ncbi:hypothetical protein GCM10023093_06240 [Nemorincola caseinilytica]|uniref:Uncharacterized protein n=1 Tax=Nemorincola caseinilytica TaxID=2054315 RepID=A0ABP8N8J7_9BACT
MNKQLLLPNKCRIAGLVLLPFSFAWMVAAYYDVKVFGFLDLRQKNGSSTSLLDTSDFLLSKGFHADLNLTVSILLTLAALFMAAFARERREDEYVRAVRLQALQISVYVNYVVLALACIFLYGGSFMLVVELDLFTIPIIFLLVYNYLLHVKPRFSNTADL